MSAGMRFPTVEKPTNLDLYAASTPNRGTTLRQMTPCLDWEKLVATGVGSILDRRVNPRLTGPLVSHTAVAARRWWAMQVPRTAHGGNR